MFCKLGLSNLQNNLSLDGYLRLTDMSIFTHHKIAADAYYIISFSLVLYADYEHVKE